MQLIHDHFQNFKMYGIPKAQLVIADIPYNIGKNAYGSSPKWYIDGDHANGESELANTQFFNGDSSFSPQDFMWFCRKMMKKEIKANNTSPCMIVFCSFWQQFEMYQWAKEAGINGCINLVFRKNFSPQVLKANMRVVGNAEYALLLFREKLPKFRNNGKMIFNVMDWGRDPVDDLHWKIHPTQKPVNLLERLITTFTDPGDVVIDPVAGSGSTLIAAENTGRKGIGFEINREFYKKALEWNTFNVTVQRELRENGCSKTLSLHRNNQQGFLFEMSNNSRNKSKTRGISDELC
jgi:site-specific DNA-methyltransferase (adenine-specific)